ncbi:MAG: radical SAM protein [Candidatus Cloacimonas sp.]|nr:radical SAM protein [Candidatus Cloacimonadota bacterium]
MKIYPIFIPFGGCETRCIYCQQELITRTEKVDIDTLIPKIEEFIVNNPNFDREIAFYGGSFTLLPITEQKRLINKIARFIPYIKGIRISTRPDGINQETLELCRSFSINTIELGIQSFSDHVLKATKRPYTSQQAVESCQLIRNKEFKLGIQLMPGLPGDTFCNWSQTVETTINCTPDYIRIYPTLVLKGTELEEQYLMGVYIPLSLSKAIVITSKAYSIFENARLKVIKMGLHSDVSYKDDQVIAGPYHPAFAELVYQHILYRKIVDSTTFHNNLCVSNKDESLLYGHGRSLLKKLERKLGNRMPNISFDENMERFTVKANQEF